MLSSITIILCTLLISSILSFFHVRTLHWNEEKYRLEESASYLLQQSYTEEELAAYAKAFKMRITVMEPDGRVTYDSEVDSESWDNHADREEVQQALRSGKGFSTRYSASLDQTLLYVALKSEGHSLVRVSRPFSVLETWSGAYLGQLFITFLGLSALAAFVVFLTIAHTTKALDILTQTARHYKEGNLSHHSSVQHPQEFALLCNTLNSMADQLQVKFQELAASSMEYQIILNAMNEAVVLLGRDKRIMLANTAFSAMFCNKQEAQGTMLETWISHNAMDESLERVFNTEEPPQALQLSFIDQFFQVQISPILKHGKGVQALVVTFSDITTLRHLEEVRKDFVANVSHELKTPLTAIAGFAELASNRETPVEEIHQFTSIIYKNTKRMQSLVEDLLLLASLEDRKTEIPLYQCEAHWLLQLAFEACKHAIDAKPIRVTISCEPDLKCKANEGLMVQALVNLLMNAIHYSEANTHIVMSAFQAGSKVCFSVQDQGYGIAKEDIARIFERFYRVDKARSRKEGGTGLGLSIVKHIVALHGGTVQVTSKSQVGSTFTIILNQ